MINIYIVVKFWKLKARDNFDIIQRQSCNRLWLIYGRPFWYLIIWLSVESKWMLCFYPTFNINRKIKFFTTSDAWLAYRRCCTRANSAIQALFCAVRSAVTYLTCWTQTNQITEVICCWQDERHVLRPAGGCGWVVRAMGRLWADGGSVCSGSEGPLAWPQVGSESRRGGPAEPCRGRAVGERRQWWDFPGESPRGPSGRWWRRR